MPRSSASRCDARLDELFEARPDEFVATRNELVRALRDAGDRACADRVKALRRPTAVVWAMNQLARRHPDQLADLLAAGDRLRAAHRALGAKNRAGLQAADRDHRKLVRTLMTAAAKILEAVGARGGAHVDRIGRMLQAEPTVHDEIREQLRRGALTEEFSAADVSEVLRLMGVDPAAGPVVQRPRAGRKRSAAEENLQATDETATAKRASRAKRAAATRKATAKQARRATARTHATRTGKTARAAERAAAKQAAARRAAATRARDAAKRAVKSAAKQARQTETAARRLRHAAEAAERAARTAGARAEAATRAAELAETRAGAATRRLAAAEKAVAAAG